MSDPQYPWRPFQFALTKESLTAVLKMMKLSKHVLHYGEEKPPPNPRTLRAGPVTLQFEDNSIRYLRMENTEILRGVYAAIRDHNWGTVLGQISDLSIEDNDHTFRVRFKSTHQQADIDFEWIGTITGDSHGTITFDFDGTANSTFQRNRIGFCVLHQMACSGLNCHVEHVDGSATEGIFPTDISPHQPFFNIRAITHQVAPKLRVRVLMEGDTFEMEDQRNWTDASYKTYCTPLGLPFPVTINQGDRIQQKITLSLEGEIPDASNSASRITFTLGDSITPLPPIGLGVASHGETLTHKQANWLKRLNISHLRCDLELSGHDWIQKLKQVTAQIKALDAQLELALFVSDNAQSELKSLRNQLEALSIHPVRIIIFHQNEKSTTAQWLRIAKNVLRGLPIGAGTNYFFTELNRERPSVDDIDFAVYSLNPQIHAFDNASLTETLSAQVITVETARGFSGGKPIVVSPVTLKMRVNPNVTGAAPRTPPGELPPQVDVRQMSLYGAGWTLGSIKYLSESQVESMTFHETTGWRGVMATQTGSPLPEKFIDIPDAVYPMWHVFQSVGTFGGEVVHSTSAFPLTVDGLALRNNGKQRVLLANYTAQSQTVAVAGFSGPVEHKQLHADNVMQAMKNPMIFNNQPTQTLQSDGTLTIKLHPYAFAQLDGTPS